MILPNTKGIGVVIIINVLQIIQDAVEDIYKKYHNMASVKMLTSKSFIMQVQINNCYGLLKDGLVTNVDAHCDIQKGDVVTTSNLGYIKSIVKIGAISQVYEDENKISNTFKIRLFNNEIISEKIIVIRGQDDTN